ncbi:hypothetical protein I547_4919 [Mycobacterium kansasii 824]|nr:hypothetical protein I547_4919 [Mycobacterium kansasii 824]KEP41134.1 hypothetical protein MKSMC1_35550 [Mycobacterium kansasii]
MHLGHFSNIYSYDGSVSTWCRSPAITTTPVMVWRHGTAPAAV